jgi:hypothetical protein
MIKQLQLLICISIFCINPCWGQNDSTTIRTLYDLSLAEGHAYENLRELCKDVGHRLSGSEGAERAVIWSKQKMESYGFDKVWLEPVMVPKWVRGEKEKCILLNTDEELDVLALGFSVATDGVLEGEVIEFQTMEALKNAPDGVAEGKIVFLNQAMNPKYIRTFRGYGDCSGGRVRGAAEAAKKGAVGFVMRSLGLRADDFPHTGVMYYEEGGDSIPAFALSTNASFKLSSELEKGGKVRLALESHCKHYPDEESYNVVGEIKGSEYPEKIITVGGHLDSWDVGEGAHDDGTGVIHSLEALRLIQAAGIQPKHTLRVVFFMNEENGARGAKAHAEACKERGDQHLFALESDAGGFSPRGFSVDADPSQVSYLNSYLDLFEPYGIHFIKKGYGGVDIRPLKDFGATLVGFSPDSQRYFDVHHTENDVFENVHKRELELGAAAISSLIYLVDKYGLPEEIID